MKFFRKVKGFFFLTNKKRLQDLKMKQGDIIACLNDDDSPYGICGCVSPNEIITITNKNKK